jgi:plastocyanin
MRSIFTAACPLLIPAVVAFSLMLNLPPGAEAQSTQNVPAGDDWFCTPSSGVCQTDITVGDTVVWTNVGSNIHTVTECDDTFSSCPPGGGGFDSGVMLGNQTFSHTFTAVGTVEYDCVFHPTNMRGRINVMAVQSTPSPAAATPVPSAPTGSTTTAPSGATPAAGASPPGQPAAAPATGGDPSDGAMPIAWFLAALSGSIVAATGIVGLSLLCRR